MIYHGTSTEAGLEPGDTILPSSTTKRPVNVQDEEMEELVFLSPDPPYAGIYAQRTARKIGGDPILVGAVPSHPRQWIEVFPGATMIAAPAAFVIRIFHDQIR